MDAEVLARVIGRRVPAAAVRPAVVEGYRRVAVARRWYPMLVPAAGGRVEGVLVAGIRPAEAARLAAYEGPEFVPAEITVRAAGRPERALAFMPSPRLAPSRRDWAPADWRARVRREVGLQDR